MVEDQAFVTLATNDAYALGALVLAHSLRQVATTRRLAIMVTVGVSQEMRRHLNAVFDSITEVNILDSRDEANLALLSRPDLGITFTKLHCWRLTQYTKCVFLDADTLVLQNCDELFEREELSAAPDVGWPDYFNSGVFVFSPNQDTYSRLLQFAITTGSFDGGDQGLLNNFFHDWSTKDIKKHLPFIYNVVSTTFYSYLPAVAKQRANVKIVHFIGHAKPWQHTFNTHTRQVDVPGYSDQSRDFLQLWWDVYWYRVQPGLSPIMQEFATQESVIGQIANLRVGTDAPGGSGGPADDRHRQFAWESGHIDYMGVDSFSNIQRKLDETLKKDNK